MQWQELRSHIRHLPARDITRIGQAFELGKKMHEGQKRRSGEPYFNHPVAVAHMLLDLKADTDTIIAALLHDTVEDTELTLPEIDREFDGSVANLIDGVTKLSSKDVEMSPKLDEQIETLRKIFTLMQQDVRIMIIKLVDRLHNMQTVEFLPPERQKLLAKETIEVFVKIADKLCMQDMRDELESLCLAVLEPENHAELLELRNTNEQRGLSLIEQIRSSFRSHDRILGSKTTLVFEQKRWDQMKAQIHVGGSVATGVSYITVALVCDDLDSCYRTLGALHQLWKREVLSFQDFINEPQLNGYRGLHTTIIVQDGTRVRCKIRTKEMHEYAREGVTTVCFNGVTEISEILPWTKRLSSLASDTKGSSNDFWDNLKSDILGETIVIHGPDDSVVQLPRDSTALDGAFELFREKALFLSSIKVNGMDVSFDTLLGNAASIDITISDHETLNHSWLRFVRTGQATAKIRTALAKMNESQKLILGQEMLQNVFTDRKRGFIEEFEEKKLQKKLNTMGFSTLNDVLISIADGRSDPDEIYTNLFEQNFTKKATKTPESIVRYMIDMDSIMIMDRINLLHRNYGARLSEIRYSRVRSGNANVKLRVHMTPQELSAFRQELLSAGAKGLVIIRQNLQSILLICCLVLLWGLDPVIAHNLLSSSLLTPSDLVFIRFGTFFIASTITYIIHMAFTPVKAKPLSLLQPSLIASAGTLFLTALLSYISLRQSHPTQYILIIIGGLLLSRILNEYRTKKSPARYLLAASTILTAILVLCARQGFSTAGLLAGIGASLGFVMYLQCSQRFQESGSRVHARYPAFVFWLSVMTMLITLLLFPYTTAFSTVGYILIGKAIVFAFIFTFLPYVLYFECMRKTDTESVDRLLPFVSIVTVAGEILTSDNGSIIFILPLIILFLWLYKPFWSVLQSSDQIDHSEV